MKKFVTGYNFKMVSCENESLMKMKETATFNIVKIKHFQNTLIKIILPLMTFCYRHNCFRNSQMI